jgi:glycosyltransferase involved in cell wall biosynthesis
MTESLGLCDPVRATEPVPRVSVVVPTYNRAALLRRAVRSVLAQTFTDYELIVVDDGSTDDTEEVLREFSDRRMRVVRSEINQGAPQARNRGIEAARGEWVAFLDSDDEWLPQRLEVQMDLLARQSPGQAAVGYCQCQVHECLTGKVSQPQETLAEGDVFEHLLRDRRPKTTSAFIVRRGALLDVGGFDEDLGNGEDIDLLLRLSQKGYRFSACNEVLVVWHWHPLARLSKAPAPVVQGFELFRRRWGRLMRQRIGLSEYCWWQLRHSNRILGVLWASARQEMRDGNVRVALRYIPVLLRFWARAISASLCVLASRRRRRRKGTLQQ